jgi:methylphosphotriester-DNA--protein-cysteine methyltransferase
MTSKTSKFDLFSIGWTSSLECAIQLLRNSINKVAGIEIEVGYKDAGNFTRAFKRWTGMSPKANFIQPFKTFWL